MNKTLKIAMVIAMVVATIFTFSNMAFASGSNAENVVTEIKPDISSVDSSNLTKMAGKVISLIQVASVILAVILIAVFGFKFIMGSANEKADYQKSFIPLIVGLVVVFAATSIAKLIMSIASGM
ncbi:MAG: hypothetical protein BHV99_02550 [Clostridium sp. 26_21]|nr:MAG: hypothetical protein BHV99_02550 [Clostridium sp. 26_21]